MEKAVEFYNQAEESMTQLAEYEKAVEEGKLQGQEKEEAKQAVFTLYGEGMNDLESFTGE